MAIKGENNVEYCNVVWEGQRTKQMELSWEKNKMVEYGASCIGILIALRKTKFPTVAISEIGTGIDYWLGYMEDDKLPLKKKARLEISGIYHGDESLFNKRVKLKLKQTGPSDFTGIPAYVVVVEFSEPKSKFVKKNEY